MLAGPHLDQQSEAAQALQTAGGLVVVHDAQTLAAQLGKWLADENLREQHGAAAQAAVQSGKGSLKATLTALEPWLKRA